ncbi:MAG TPA: hypothetical protein VF306_22000 [Pirellulales bacterium]
MKAFSAAIFLLLTHTAAWPAVAVPQAAFRPIGATRPALRTGRLENRWRYVWHNDRWWYWTRANRWAYFDGREWSSYDPRRPPTDALTFGYRKAPAFERPPAVPPHPPRTLDLAREPRSAASSELGGPPPPVLGAPAGAVLPEPDGRRAGVEALSSPPVGGASRDLGRTNLGRRFGSGAATGGGGFGGPTGRSLGAGSAAGGASTPQ